MSALTPLFEGERTKLGHRGIGENDPPRTLGLIKFEAGFGHFFLAPHGRQGQSMSALPGLGTLSRKAFASPCLSPSRCRHSETTRTVL
jgi:hypothetical protein